MLSIEVLTILWLENLVLFPLQIKTLSYLEKIVIYQD